MKDDEIKRNRELLCQALGVKDSPNVKAHCCMFHAEKTPSLNIFQNENGVWFFKCFGCGISGDVFKAVMLVQRCDFRQARSWIEHQLGVRIETNKLAPRSEIDMPRATELVLKAHETLMNDPDILSAHMRGYRGIHSTREIERLKVGFVWDTPIMKREWSTSAKRFIDKHWMQPKRAWVLPITERGELKGVKLHADPIIGENGRPIPNTGHLFQAGSRDGGPVKSVKCSWVPLRMTDGGRSTMQTLWPSPEDYENTDSIVLCGGELKAICLASCEGGMPATSVTSGESVKHKDAALFGKKKFDDAVIQMYMRLKRFRNIFINYDDDFTGRKYRDDVLELFAYLGLRITAFAFRMPAPPAAPIVASVPEIPSADDYSAVREHVNAECQAENPTCKDCLQVQPEPDANPTIKDCLNVQSESVVENDDQKRYFAALHNNYGDMVRRWCEANDSHEAICDYVPFFGYAGDPLPVGGTWCAHCGSPGIYEGGGTMVWTHNGKRCLPKFDPPGVWINREI